MSITLSSYEIKLSFFKWDHLIFFIQINFSQYLALKVIRVELPKIK